MKKLQDCLASLTVALTLCLAGQTAPCALAADAEAKALDLIHDGWKEYQYREFSLAKKLFIKAEKAANSNIDKVQAITGQAFCLQFGKKAEADVQDYEDAIELYNNALKLSVGDVKLQQFLNSMIAECSYRIYALSGDEKKFDAAEAIWSKLQAEAPNSLITQDALLFKNINMTKSYASPENLEKMAAVAKQIEGAKAVSKSEAPDAKALTQVMANYLARVNYWRGNYKDAVTWYEEYLKLGPTSYAVGVTTTFQVARISELKLNDKKTAAEYYALFSQKYPVDSRRYFTLLKVEELNKALAKEAGR